jgi:alkylresorcinol/alkylpyrone synthase
MAKVRVATAAVAHPEYRVAQEEAARRLGEVTGSRRRVLALARATRIEQRALVLPAEALAELGSIEARNSLYRGAARGLAGAAAAGAAPAGTRDAIGCLVTSSCTGYSVPGWGVDLIGDLGLGCDTARLPITESGCAGGAVALARAADYLRSRPNTSALVVAAELCSLSFHARSDEGNLTSSLIFGDGAGAALLEAGEGQGLEVVDTLSMLIPESKDALGFDLTDHGFYPVLKRELVELLPGATLRAARKLLERNGLDFSDVSGWLIHPGGARILSRLEQTIGVGRQETGWSWESMKEFGNTSSAAIFDVLRRYLADEGRPRGWAMVVGFGPGVSIELLLVRG